jgi:hypothetical protein
MQSAHIAGCSRDLMAPADKRTRALAHPASGKLLVYHQSYPEAPEPLGNALHALPGSTEAMKYLARAELPLLTRAVDLNPPYIQLRHLSTDQYLNLKSKAQTLIAAIESFDKAGEKP